MRKIIFKAKKVDNGEWIKGYYLKEDNTDFIITTNQSIKDNNFKESIIDIKTLSQYTGLKDKNGLQIYENDTVNIKYQNTIIINAIIEYKGASFYGSTDSDDWELDNYCEIEIIGNIYDNYLNEDKKIKKPTNSKEFKEIGKVITIGIADGFNDLKANKYCNNNLLEKRNKEIFDMKQENKFLKLKAHKQLQLLLTKYWLTHSNDCVFEQFKCNYVPCGELQDEARKIIDNDNIKLEKHIDINKINKEIIKNTMANKLSYKI